MRHQENCTDSESSFPAIFHRFTGLLKKRFVLAGLVAAALVASSAMSARADDLIRAVRISNVVGSVQILTGTETQFSQVYPNMPLMQGCTLKTGEDGRAEIQFEDGSVTRVTPNSSIALSVLSRSSDGNLNTGLDLLTGLSYVEMKGTVGQHFVVHFGANEVVSPAPVKFRVNLDSNPVEFAVLDGSAHLSNGSAYSVDVHANETIHFDSTDSSRYFLAQGVDGDSWDQWNTDRDQAMGQMAAMETREARSNANPENPGWSDLDYYGNWYSTAGGSVWAPAGAGAGWDPYGSGYWGFYGNSGGYVWISGYPWGWLPYQCGAWNYYNAFGWGWNPGSCGYPGYGYGGAIIGNAPPRYHRVPHPNPVRPVSGGLVAHQRLIAVNRGHEATTLEPRSVAPPKTTQLNGAPASLMPKTGNPGYTPVSRVGSTLVPVTRTSNGIGGSTGIGSVPVYRPTAPSSPGTGNRASAPTSSFGGHSGGSAPTPSHSSYGGGAPSMSGGSHASAPSGGSMGGGGGGGGGHVK
jgi:hypothetical protein